MAIKQLSMEKFREEYQKKALITEISLQKELSSPYTVQYYDHYMGKNYAYIISELCDSDLKNMLFQHGDKLPENECVKVFSDVMKGFKVLIDKGYIHRDVKPENVLIKKGVHKLADFGFSVKADVHGASKIKEICGTPIYMAPQQLLNQEYTAKCDIWSLGLMLYEMLFGFGPWPNKHPAAYKHYILTKPVSFPYRTNIGENTRDFILKCLVVSEEDRISWKEVFQHPFISS